MLFCDTCGNPVEQGQTLEPNWNIQLRLWMPEKQIVISKEKQVKKCSVCDKVLKENKVIPKLEHKYENNILQKLWKNREC